MMNTTNNPESERLTTFEAQSQRCLVGLNVACYTDASVRALFGEETAPEKEAA